MEEKVEELLSKVSKEEIKEFLLKLPKDVRNMLSESEIEILDVMELLPPNIANGRILKVTIEDLLNVEEGTQTGLLYALEDGVSVKLHEHVDSENGNMETYVAINGNIQINGQKMGANICKIGGKHGIEDMKKGDIIGTFKVRKDRIGEYFGKKKEQSELEK